jgi:hypothetical protein
MPKLLKDVCTYVKAIDTAARASHSSWRGLIAVYLPMLVLALAIRKIIVTPADTDNAIIFWCWIFAFGSLAVLLLFAPFRVWREDQVKIGGQRSQDDLLLGRELLAAAQLLKSKWLLAEKCTTIQDFGSIVDAFDSAAGPFETTDLNGSIIRLRRAITIRSAFDSNPLVFSGQAQASNDYPSVIEEYSEAHDQLVKKRAWVAPAIPK